MPKKSPNRPNEIASDVDKMKLDYFKPKATLSDIAKKYNLSLNTVYYISKLHNWTPEKKAVNEIALLEATAAYIKKRKHILLEDLEAIDGIKDKVFQRLKNIRPDLIKVTDMVALIKIKYDLLSKFGTNKPIIEQNVKEGDTNFNFNISESELDVKIANLAKDLKMDNRIKALLKDVKKKDGAG